MFFVIRPNSKKALQVETLNGDAATMGTTIL